MDVCSVNVRLRKIKSSLAKGPKMSMEKNGYIFFAKYLMACIEINIIFNCKVEMHIVNKSANVQLSF